MKKFILSTLIVIFANTINAQCNGGKIEIDTSQCRAGMVLLKLNNHSTVAGTTYSWEFSEDGGLTFSPFPSNSGQDTQLVSSTRLDRRYRCLVTCVSGAVYSDTFSVEVASRSIELVSVFCGATGDSLLLAFSPSLDTLADSSLVHFTQWESSHFTYLDEWVWDTIVRNQQTFKTPIDLNKLNNFRAYYGICPQSSQLNEKAIYTPDFDLNDDIGLDIIDRDCVNDTAILGLTGVSNRMKSLFQYEWYESIDEAGPYVKIVGATDTFLKTKVSNQNKYYFADLKFCTTSINTYRTDTFHLITQLGDMSITPDCENDMIIIDYENREAMRNTAYTYWTKSENDSTSHLAFTDPVDSPAYKVVLENKTDDYYKIYSMFCETSTTILDSTFNQRVYLDVDSGQLEVAFNSCPDNTVKILLDSFKAESSLPLFIQWENYLHEDFKYRKMNPHPLDIDSINVNYKHGLTKYRKSVGICESEYSKKYYSTEASVYMPYLPIMNSDSCFGNLTIKVKDDSIQITDHNSTLTHPGPFTYQWLSSADDVTYTIVPGLGAKADTITIANSGKDKFYKREIKVCPLSADLSAASFSSLGDVSGIMVPQGQTKVTGSSCLSNIVKLSVVNDVTRPGETVQYVWQKSSENVNWTDIEDVYSNADSLFYEVGTDYQYFRRISKWCNSGNVYFSKSVSIVDLISLPYNESFDNMIVTGMNVFYDCWNHFSPVCANYIPTFGNVGLVSMGGGRTGVVMSHQPNQPQPQVADGKLVSPSFPLKRGKIYRFSFWHKETIDGQTPEICFDSLYMTWGTSLEDCNITNKFGRVLTDFNFDQWNRYWADFIPEHDGIYFFGINYRNAIASMVDFDIDDIELKEIDSCHKANNITAGTTFAPSKIIDRFEDPDKAQNYDKENVTHQYCIGDTIMLTYQDNDYDRDFDYYGMSYQFYKKQEDIDWKQYDTMFKKVEGLDPHNCHVKHYNDYHVMNTLVDDTNTWYKLVATCDFDGREFHADSLLVNGTHSVPFCNTWESVGDGNINNQMSGMPQLNSGEIAYPATWCPRCWNSYPLAGPFFSITLPFGNPGNPLPPPQLFPDAGYDGDNVVINSELGAAVGKKVLVMPATRLYKDRGYRVSFRWTDNRWTLQQQYGFIAQDLDSLYVVAVKKPLFGTEFNIDSFDAKYIIKLETNLQSNLLTAGKEKYNTFWADWSPPDTNTYHFAICAVPGPGAAGTYKFYMDYFCIDTLKHDPCGQPYFASPLRINIKPDGKVWFPHTDTIKPRGERWCAGNEITMEMDFAKSGFNNWNYGWKFFWESNDKSGDPDNNWVIEDSSTNNISFILTYKYKKYRLRIVNACGQDTIVGPFEGVSTPGQFPWFEGFDASIVEPSCWDFHPSNFQRMTINNGVNMFNQGAMSPKNYLNMDYASGPAQGEIYPTIQTAIPPGFGLEKDLTIRFSFWYRDNGISRTFDSLEVGWSLKRQPLNVYPAANRLVNKVNDDIVRDFSEKHWRYYTTEFTPTLDTGHHFRVKSFNTKGTEVYHLMLDNFMMKLKHDTDALVIAIDSPECGCDLPNNAGVKVTVMNIGFDTLPNIPVKVSVDGGAPVAAIVTGPINPNEVKSIVVPVDLSTPKALNVTAWTEVPFDQDPSDDAFNTVIVHNELYDKPSDSIDSFCRYSQLVYSAKTPNKSARWYVDNVIADPFQIGDTIRIDSFNNDTCFYVSASNGKFCRAGLKSFAEGGGTFVYSNATATITFHNRSKDTLLLDSVTMYSNSTGTRTISLSRYGENNPNGNNPRVLPVNVIGKHKVKIGWKIPPGTDYVIRYTGTARMLRNEGGARDPSQISCSLLDFYLSSEENYNYFYDWEVINPGCETERRKMCFKVNEIPIFSLKDTNRVCTLPVYKLQGPQPFLPGDKFTYKWNIKDTFNNNFTDSFVEVQKTSPYILTITNIYNCTYEDSIFIVVDPSPEPDLGNDTSFCKYSPHLLDTKLDSVNNIVVWNNAMSGTKVNVLNPGTYIATAFDIVNFCEGKDTIVLTRNDLPDINLGNDRVFCGSSGNIGELLNTNGISYVWDNTFPGPDRIVPNSGKYWVVGTDDVTGCVKSDTIVATIIPNPVFSLGDDEEICGANTTLEGPFGNYFYTWSTTSTDKDILVSDPGTYTLTVTDSVYGCSSTDDVVITFKGFPTFDLGDDYYTCDAPPYTIDGPVLTGVTYKWTGPGVNGVSTNVNVDVDETGVYYLEVDNDCYTYTDSVEVRFKVNPSTELDSLPDEVRDCKKVELTATNDYKGNTIRWGFPLFTSSNKVTIDKTGTYSVSLSNECGSATKAINVIIDEDPEADFKIDYPSNTTIALTNLSVGAESYLWDFGDGNTSDEINPIHTYKEDGKFMVTLNVTNTCGSKYKSIATGQMIGDTSGLTHSSSIKDITKSEIVLFPNPASSSSILYSESIENGDYTLKLYDVIGQLIFSRDVQVRNNKIEEKIEVTNLANGEYMIHVSSDEKTITRKLQISK